MSGNADYVCDECGVELHDWNAAAHHEWVYHDRRKTTRPAQIDSSEDRK